jgi:2-oxoglutarate ferredoxin oxidoreductase subunit beta
LLSACRGNHDVLTIVHNNQLYGLTTGQFAPTSVKGFVSKSTPEGSVDKRMNPLAIALTEGATFIAQAFAGNTRQMTKIIAAGLAHAGFGLINILQPCVTFNGVQTYQYYLKNCYELSADYDAGDRSAALAKCLEYDAEKYPTGVIYRSTEVPYHENVGLTKESKPLSSNADRNDFSLLIKDFA